MNATSAALDRSAVGHLSTDRPAIERSAAAPRIEALQPARAASGRRTRGGTLPPALASGYGADLVIALRDDRPTIVANFVTTLDGVVAFDTEGRSGGREISGGFAPDRFLMGLLRATADAVLVGAGTMRSGSKHVWTPGHVHPPSADAFAAWRRQLALPSPQPTTVVVTATGELDPGHPGLRAPDVPVLIVTTGPGADRLARRPLPEAVEVAVAGHERIDPAALVSELARRRLDLVVSEGGPTLFASLLGADIVDELFLTIAPQIAGRAPDMPRLALVEGLGYEIGASPWAELRSVMRAGDHLFLRYGLHRSSPPDGERP